MVKREFVRTPLFDWQQVSLVSDVENNDGTKRQLSR